MGYYPPFVTHAFSDFRSVSPLVQPKADKVHAVNRVHLNSLSPFSNQFLLAKQQEKDKHLLSNDRKRINHMLGNKKCEEKGKYIDHFA